MALLASKSPYAAPANHHQMPPRNFSETTQRTQLQTALQDDLFTSPTESEFSDVYDGLEAIRAWDEKKVVEWLHSIRCGQYEQLFRANNFTGEALLECDQKILSEIGIKKIGDRVKINVAIKQLRNKSTLLRNRKNRDSLAALEGWAATPPASESPRSLPNRNGTKRFSRQIDLQALRNYSSAGSGIKTGSRPSSPLADSHSTSLRAHRYAASPMDTGRRDGSAGYFSQPGSASSTSGRRPGSPSVAAQTTRAMHLRQNSSIDGLTPGGLPLNSPVIKVIHTSGQTKVVNIKYCKNADEVTATVLKKLLLPETHFRNYCFYVLDGLQADPTN